MSTIIQSIITMFSLLIQKQLFPGVTGEANQVQIFQAC